MTSLTMTLPDDWHIHLRDGSALAVTVPDITRWAGRAIVMPNLTPPVLTVNDDGEANLPVLAPRLSMEDMPGRSLMIHAGGDTYADEPHLGGGGARIFLAATAYCVKFRLN